ncbi:MAG: hypothetical protein JNM93_12200 [Bacteriovoracaceae bacterium]|nr:hypothetical protein [Bacteriovoracaceae bacterium]
MTLEVYRTDYSSYLSSDFSTQEEAAINAISGLKYVKNPPKSDCILVTTSNTVPQNIDAEVLKRCQLIIHPNSGYDLFSLKFLEEHKFPVLIGNEIRAQAVAQYILSCLFNHLVAPPFNPKWDKKRLWNRDLLGRLSCQIIGYGHIGKILEKTLAPLNMKVRIFDPYATDLAHSEIDYKSNILIMACGLNSENHHLVNGKFLKKFPKNLLFINAARGKLVKESDLTEYLKTNPEAFAYLDVFETEPLEKSELQKLSNVKMSSHIAGCSHQLEQSMLDFEVKVMNDFLFWPDNFREKYKNVILQNRIHKKILI